MCVGWPSCRYTERLQQPSSCTDMAARDVGRPQTWALAPVAPPLGTTSTARGLLVVYSQLLHASERVADAAAAGGWRRLGRSSNDLVTLGGVGRGGPVGGTGWWVEGGGAGARTAARISKRVLER